jgi:hypothetical protein
MNRAAAVNQPLVAPPGSAQQQRDSYLRWSGRCRSRADSRHRPISRMLGCDRTIALVRSTPAMWQARWRRTRRQAGPAPDESQRHARLSENWGRPAGLSPDLA